MEDPRQVKDFIRDQEKDKMRYLSITYGSHLPFRLLYERNTLADPKRFGFESSSLGLEIMTGRDTTLDFPDYIEEKPNFTQEITKISFD